MSRPPSPRPPSVPCIRHLFRDGFRQMTLGRTQGKIMSNTLFIMLAILKFFFFPDFLAITLITDAQRAGRAIE